MYVHGSIKFTRFKIRFLFLFFVARRTPNGSMLGNRLGRRYGFLSGGGGTTNRRRYDQPTPQNTVKIGKDTGFGPIHSRA